MKNGLPSTVNSVFPSCSTSALAPQFAAPAGVAQSSAAPSASSSPAAPRAANGHCAASLARHTKTASPTASESKPKAMAPVPAEQKM
ncbi:MAG: hypothetical protein ACLPYS_19335 [Vulcanimicrobiaceae bacterium]